MTIIEAFRLRNRLKDRIRYLKELTANAQYVKNEGTEEFTRPLDGKTLKETIEATDSFMDLLCIFSQAIESANAVNRTDLVRMESLKQKLSFYSEVLNKCRKTKEYEIEYSNGSYTLDSMIKVIKVLVIDQPGIAEKRNALISEIDKLEAKLARQNSKIEVDFDLSKIEEVL